MEDAKVRFADDGPDGPVFVRYEDNLMTWPEFVGELREAGLNSEFAAEYVKSLVLEIL